MGTWCLCLSQCCHPNCFGNSYLLLMLVAGRAPLNCRHITHSGCPSCWLLSMLHCHKTHHEWVSEWLIWNKIIAQGSCHSVWAVEKGCSPGAVRLYALGSLPCASPQPPELMSFSTLSFEEHRPKTKAVQDWPLNLSHLCVGLKSAPPSLDVQPRCSRPYKAHTSTKPGWAIYISLPSLTHPALHGWDPGPTLLSQQHSSSHRNSHLTQLRAATKIPWRADEPHWSLWTAQRGEHALTPLRQRLLFPTKTLHILSQSSWSSAPTQASK